MSGKETEPQRVAACRCKGLYAEELRQGTAVEKPNCVRLRLITRDGKEMNSFVQSNEKFFVLALVTGSRR